MPRLFFTWIFGKMNGLDSRVPGMIFAGIIKIYPKTRTLSPDFAKGYAAAETLAGKLKPE